MCITSCILVDKMEDIHYDLCVIGGGINGAGIARDAAGRGLSVLLVEAQDLAGATSSACSKLIHGGLRYLEHYEFGLVRKALHEREALLKAAPHLIWPIECIVPMEEGGRPKWMLRLGLWLYDRLAGNKSLPDSRFIKFDTLSDDQNPMKRTVKSGFGYMDCQADDSRLVVMNAVDAAGRGAKVLTYTACDKLEIHDGRWRVSLRDTRSDDSIKVSASMVANATGPWVRQFLDSIELGGDDPDLPSVRLVKGSHLILPRQHEVDKAYVLQQGDGRIVFVTPYEGKYTLVGTTEEDFHDDPRNARISNEEIDYLCNAYNDGFEKSITKDDAVFTFSGIRPLLDDGNQSASKVTRDHLIYHHSRYDAPLLSVFGGKLTTYRVVAEDVVDRLMALSARTKQAWTAREPLAGGDIGEQSFNAFCRAQKKLYPWLPDTLIWRYARAYGTHMDFFLNDKKSIGDLGAHYGDGVYAAEINYLKTHEWATTSEDVVWRRSKMALHVSDETLQNIEAAFSIAQ